jgi:hypothetical protein
MERQFREPSEATRQKMSLRKQGCNNPMYGKSRDEATKEKISLALQRYWQTIPSNNNNEFKENEKKKK